jgi:S-layer protein
MSNISTNGTEITRFAGALYGEVLNNATYTEAVNSANSYGLTNLLNAVYARDFGTTATSSVAATVATNLGLTGTLLTTAETYITGVLNAAAPGTQGAAISGILDQFAGLTSDATWGTAATAWEGKVGNALLYSQNTADTSFGSISTTSSTTPGQTFTLTSGIDHFIGGPAGNNTFNASASTFSALDTLSGGGGTGNVLNITDTANAISTSNAVNATVTGIQTANLVDSGNSITADTTGWTGLTTLNTTDTTHQQTLNAAATTNVTSTATTGGITVDGGLNVTTTSKSGSISIGTGSSSTAAPAGVISVSESSQGGSSISVQGGTNVSITTVGNTGGSISAGTTTKPSGTITINNTVNGSASGGSITTKGGTVVSITQTLSASAATNTTAFEGSVTVTGGSGTTTVTVNQASAAATSAVTGVSGVVGVSKVTAAPGTQGVSNVTAVNNVNAVTGVAGASAGGVTIQDANYNTTKANTITSVTLDNYGNSTISDNALSTLSLTGTGGTLAITNATAAGATPTSNSTLSLTVNGLTGSNNTITDTNGEIATLNVTTAGADSTLGGFSKTSGSGVSTLNVSGTNVLTLNTIPTTLTTISISGGAGFNDAGAGAGTGLAALAAGLTSFTTTSSGAITATLDDQHQTFVGSTGQDVITIDGHTDATKTITGGSATNNELILDGKLNAAYGLTSATTKLVTGFEILGVAANVTGTIDMSIFGSGYKTLDVLGNSTIAFTKVTSGSALNLDGSSTSVSVQYVDATGVSDTTTVTIGSATTHGLTEAALTLQDANTVGIGTVNFVSNGADFPNNSATPYVNTITALTDNGLANLNVSGTESMVIAGLAETANQATAFTLNNTDTGSLGVAISSFTDAKLGSLTFTGTGTSTINTLVDATSTTLSISNTGSHTATIGAWAATALTSLTLSNGVAVTATADAATTGITISGAADNAHVTFAATAGAGANATDTITLGNANNSITDASTLGTVNVTVGTGSNLIVLGTAATDASTSSYSVTLGTHTATTGIDNVSIGALNVALASITAPNLVITGAVKGDVITLAGDAAANTVLGTATTAGSTVALTIAAIGAAADAAADHVAYSVFGGNTYVAESNATGGGAATLTVIELVGSHTFTAGTGLITVAS